MSREEINVGKGVGYIKEFNGTLVIGTEEKFEPVFEWIEKRVKLDIKSVGKRYAPNAKEYQALNIDTNLNVVFSYIDDLSYVERFNSYAQDVLDGEYHVNNRDELIKFINSMRQTLPQDIEEERKKLNILRNDNQNNLLGLDQNLWDQLDNPAKHGYSMTQAHPQEAMISRKFSRFSKFSWNKIL